MVKIAQEEVLKYQKGRRSQETVRRHYLNWRSQQDPPMPVRCDNPECTFYTAPLIWNGKDLKLILDHKNGVNGDNRPKNLRFLCPNCNSQEPTFGGGNKSRVKQSAGGFAQKSDDGKFHYTLPAEAGKLELNGDKIKTTHRKKTPNKIL